MAGSDRIHRDPTRWVYYYFLESGEVVWYLVVALHSMDDIFWDSIRI